MSNIELRDYFAAKADVALYNPVETLEAKLKRMPTVGELAEYVALVRFAEADAMLAARAATQPSRPAPDADGWIEWHGGDCPVAGDTIVEVVRRCGESIISRASTARRWQHVGEAYDIVRYRVVKRAAGGDAEGWIEWHGGERPVSADTMVWAELRYGEQIAGSAGRFLWDHRDDAYDIVRYRIVEGPSE